jgi:hypothetical protein
MSDEERTPSRTGARSLCFTSDADPGLPIRVGPMHHELRTHPVEAVVRLLCQSSLDAESAVDHKLLSLTAEEVWALQKHELVAAFAELQKEVKRLQSHLVDDTHVGAVRVDTACRRLLGKLGAQPVPSVSVRHLSAVPQMARRNFASASPRSSNISTTS